jgi:hypothetical protein
MLRDLLTAGFRNAYSTAPTLLGRAPGRVNLIGEHVDYCGLAVFPMAIQRGITLAARPRADTIARIANLEPRFPLREFTLGRDIPPLADGDWGNYLQAAAQAVVRRYGDLRGIDAIIASDLPIAAGLSSSAALVVAVAVTLLAANGTSFDLHELMELLAAGERYVGTAGGGMDQAISSARAPATPPASSSIPCASRTCASRTAGASWSRGASPAPRSRAPPGRCTTSARTRPRRRAASSRAGSAWASCRRMSRSSWPDRWRS